MPAPLLKINAHAREHGVRGCASLLLPADARVRGYALPPDECVRERELSPRAHVHACGLPPGECVRGHA